MSLGNRLLSGLKLFPDSSSGSLVLIDGVIVSDPRVDIVDIVLRMVRMVIGQVWCVINGVIFVLVRLHVIPCVPCVVKPGMISVVLSSCWHVILLIW